MKMWKFAAVVLVLLVCIGLTLHMLNQAGFTLHLPNPHAVKP